LVHSLPLSASASTTSGAPLLDALRRSYQVLGEPPQANANIRGIVLFTDGGLTETPVCAGNDDWELLLEEARVARDLGIYVNVVALPGSEVDLPALRELAEIFGCPQESCLFDLTEAGGSTCIDCDLCELADPRWPSSGGLCSFQLPQDVAADYEKGEVTLNTFDPRTNEANTIVLTPDQWWIDDSGPTLELSPEACDLTDNLTDLTAEFPCEE
jgi:hypothetical protein